MYKQIIVVRTDIEMSRGKLAGQVAHAAIAATQHADCNSNDFNIWFNNGRDQKKVVLAAENEDHLINLVARAMVEELPVAVIYDQGKTELPPNTLTCIGIGPAESHRIDKITSTLPLLK